MKKYTKHLLSLLMIGISFSSCEDEELITLPVWETAVHGYAVVNGTQKDFKKGDASISLELDLKWKSIDNKNAVTKIDIYVLFNEKYKDIDGNEKSIKHGGDSGKLIKSISGSAVPANNVATSFKITQDEVYKAYSDIKYDYGFGAGSVSVFANPLKPSRNALTNKFIPGDNFTVKWIFTTEDGRVFDSWSPSVCTEFPEANCQVDWTVVCATGVEKRTGDWTIFMEDLYGDGWQGGKVQAWVDGELFEEVGLNSRWDGGQWVNEDTVTISIPAGSTSLVFKWTNDDYNGECHFTIKNPNGNLLADISGPSAGEIKLDLCNE
tara:strand:- start:47 stop:1012 length:966 start_codon:yes stop_codon:yes gene_type:complete